MGPQDFSHKNKGGVKTKSFLICWLHNFADFSWISIGKFIKLSVQTSLQTSLIVIYRRGYFVSYHRGSTSIYRPLSYPFRSLIVDTIHSSPRYESHTYLFNKIGILHIFTFNAFYIFSKYVHVNSSYGLWNDLKATL